ncbi:hypothetical protein [Streptomyces chrestomyceticus]|uniref:hypothetical protein n=1 Tax=Streptomyces chrestomyceticus TaxID=68185 RepID=UPI0033CCDB48
MVGFITHSRETHREVEAAFRLAVEWCSGHRIDGAPAIAHALKVTRTLGVHCPDAPAHVIAATLLHDAPDLAPADGMERRVTAAAGLLTLSFVKDLYAEHAVLAHPTEAAGTAHLHTLTSVPYLMAAAVADKIIAFQYAIGLAERAPDPAAFWAGRGAFTRLLPYFHRVHRASDGVIPHSMTAAYGHLLARCPKVPAPPGSLSVFR